MRRSSSTAPGPEAEYNPNAAYTRRKRPSDIHRSNSLSVPMEALTRLHRFAPRKRASSTAPMSETSRQARVAAGLARATAGSLLDIGTAVLAAAGALISWGNEHGTHSRMRRGGGT